MIKINSKLINGLTEKAAQSERKRVNHNFHKELSDTLQRLLNVMEPSTYVRPHKHEDPDKREAFIILKGRAVAVEFNNTGDVTDYFILDPAIENFGVEIPERTWHTIIALDRDTVVYEVKDGPYNPINDKNFAPWAPAEYSHESIDYNQKLLRILKL
jgi:cupin fold WbuC family metalloprotein